MADVSISFKKRNFKDIAGQKYNKLAVLRRAHRNNSGSYLWECLCDCGRTHFVRSADLKNGTTKSCGCLKKNEQYVTKKMSNMYDAMLDRCYNIKNKRYHDYGGRNIRVCEEWKGNRRIFYKWISEREDYSKGMQLDRIDNNGDYTPANCRFVTAKIQANNRRSNRILCFNSLCLNTYEWETITGIRAELIRKRLNNGWKIERALTERPKIR